MDLLRYRLNDPEKLQEGYTYLKESITLMKNSMLKDEWKEKELIVKQYLKDSLMGITSLSSKAYLGIGNKPE